MQWLFERSIRSILSFEASKIQFASVFVLDKIFDWVEVFSFLRILHRPAAQRQNKPWNNSKLFNITNNIKKTPSPTEKNF